MFPTCCSPSGNGVTRLLYQGLSPPLQTSGAFPHYRCLLGPPKWTFNAHCNEFFGLFEIYDIVELNSHRWNQSLPFLEPVMVRGCFQECRCLPALTLSMVSQVHHSGRPQAGNGGPAAPSHCHQRSVLAVWGHQVPEERGVLGRHWICQPLGRRLFFIFFKMLSSPWLL